MSPDYRVNIFVFETDLLTFFRYSVLINISKTVYHEEYSTLELIFASEFLKLMMSAIFCTFQQQEKGSNTSWISRLVVLAFHGKKVIFVVLLYSFSNMIPYFSIARVGAPIFSVCIQLKILTTAGFAKLVLGKQTSWTKWRALILLVVGCILVASPIINSTDKESESQYSSRFQKLLGLASILVLCCISGFTSVYLEAIVKDQEEKYTIWDRNFQLALYSIIVLGIFNFLERSVSLGSPSSYSGGGALAVQVHPSFASGWGWTAFALVLMQAVGGMLVAATLKYADAVLKCFATSVAIILTSAIGYVFLDSQVDLVVSLGMVITVMSIFNYTLDYERTNE